MTTAAPAPEDVLEKVDALGPPGTPVTTPEVAEEFDCTQRTIYNRLESLVDDGTLLTKKVGANSRVWWHPVDGKPLRNGDTSDRQDSVSSRDGKSPSLTADSEMAARINEFEWADTPLGSMDEWPPELRVAVDIMFGADEAIGIYWGEDLTLLYNDLARDVIGRKHPDALGQPARNVFPEAWDTLGPIHEQVMAGDGATRLEEFLLPLERTDEIEDVWWDSSYSPIPLPDGSIGGVFNIAVDVTDQKRRERNTAFLEDLEAELTQLTTPEEIVTAAGERINEYLDVAVYNMSSIDEEADTVDHLYRWEDDIVRPLPDTVSLSEFSTEEFQETARAGEPIVSADTHEDRYTDPQAAETIDVRSFITVPFHRDGEWEYLLSLTDPDPRDWREDEVELVQELANRLFPRLERARAEQALRESEQRNRRLFDSINESIEETFFIVERLADESKATSDRENLVDYRFVETNPAFEKRIGVTDVVGKLVSDLDLDGDLPGSDLWDEVVRTGDSRRFEIETTDGPLADGWYDVRIFPYGSTDSGAVACLVDDITERKEAEEELQQEAELDAFRIELTDVIRPLSDPEEIQREAARVLGEWLDVDRAHYGEVLEDGTTNRIHADYCREGFDSVVGEHDFEDYGEYISDTFQAGETIVLDDISSIPELSEQERAAHRQMGIAAYTSVPLVKNGRLIAYCGVTQATPRDWTDTEVAMLEETAERTWAAVERAQAEQKVRESEAALERLNNATRGLIDAETVTIADRVAPILREVLAVEYAALWQYDDRGGDLREYAADAAGDVDIEAVEFPNEIGDQVWETFVGTDIKVENDRDLGSDVTSPLRSRAFVPLGRHGVVCLGSTRADTFDDRTVELAETVAATVETAWDRAAGEQELADQNEELTRLDRLNTLIREIDQVLVAADTREEIDAAVCERLASSDLYEFAWIGDHDPGTGGVEPRAWAGVDSGYLEDLTITVEDTPTNRDPIARAVRTGTLQVVADIATDSDFAPWREATLERGARSLVCIPLVYDDATYGVLTVYADYPQSNGDERNQQVLSELGDTIAHTINARETRATLQTDSVVELTLRFGDADTPLCRLARETECTIDYQGFVPRSNGQADVFFIARGISPADLQATASHLLAFDDLDCLTEGADGALFRARVSDPTLAARVTDDGAVVRSITIDASVATAALDVPHTAAVREFLDRLRQWNPNFELRARQSCERPLKTRQTFATALEDQLTDRQREVLQTAYLSGYFKMPRVSNGQEVTELLGVSQPTFSEHLRAAERALCEVLFETESYADDIGLT